MSNNRSKVIKVMNTAPGIFSRDDNLAKSPAAPFFYLDGNRTVASDDDAENTIIKHIDTKADADLDDITGHRYTGVVGCKKLFTATSPVFSLMVKLFEFIRRLPFTCKTKASS